MGFDREQARNAIRQRIAELAGELGHDASSLGDDDVIPAAGLLDSAAILGLIVWCEETFGAAIELDEISVHNFGSVNRMLGHLETLSSS